MSTELTKINKIVIGGQKFGLAKRIAERQSESISDYSKFPNRLGIVMDDSGSMNGSMDKVHLAIDTFIKNCSPNDTAIALYPLNVESRSLTNIFASIGLYANSIEATGGTPLYEILTKMLNTENITRAIAFSDGQPNWGNQDEVCNAYKAKDIPIDTIFIGPFGSGGYQTMKQIADKTGGIFLHFTDASVLAKSLKYLTPHYRALLSDDNTRKQVEKGTL